MKRFLSIMLTVMLVLSSFVMVSASEDTFNVISVDDTTFEYQLGTTYTGNYEISADIYVTADVTTASIGAAGEVAAIEINEETVNTWQAVKVNVVNASFSNISFKAEGGTMYVNNIKVSKLYDTKLVYSEDFENAEVVEYTINNTALTDHKFHYIKSNGINFALKYSNDSVTERLDYKVSEGIGGRTKVGDLYKHNFAISPDPVNSYGISSTSIHDFPAEPAFTGIDDNEHAQINLDDLKNATNIVVEFDLYNVGDRLYLAGEEREQILNHFVFGVGEQSDYFVLNDNGTLPIANIKANEVGLGTIGAATVSADAPAKTWQKVVYEAKRYQENGSWTVDYSVTYGGTTVKHTVKNAKVSNFGKFFIGVNDVYGGRFYIDNIKIYELNENINYTQYEEDFEGSTLDADVPKATLHNDVADPNNSLTYTVAQNIGGRTGKVGKLYRDAAKDDYRGVNDAGTAGDILDVGTGLKDKDSYYVTLKNPNTTNVKVEFDVYNAYTRSLYGSKLDNLRMSVRDSKSGDLFGLDVPRATIYAKQVSTKIVENTESSDFGLGTSGVATATDYSRTWTKVVYEAERKQEADGSWTVDYSVTYGDQKLENSISNAAASDFGYLGLSVEFRFGGLIYLDNIKVTSPVETAADLANANTYASAVFEKSADVEDSNEEFEVTTVSFGGEKDSVNIIKMPGKTESVQVVTAVYKDNVLHDAVVTPVTTPLNVFAENNIQLTKNINLPSEVTEYQYKVFVFNSAEGLKPLADMLSGTEPIETPAE